MKKNKNHLVLISFLLGLALAQEAFSQKVYEYKFGAVGTSSLLGQAPDVRPADEVFASNDSAAQSATIQANGLVTGDSSPAYYLPYRVVSGKKNIVSLEVQLTPGAPANNAWWGITFARGASLPRSDEGLADAYSALFLLRENGQAQFLSWGAQSDNVSRTLNATSGRMEIILDNSSPNADLWMIEYRLNGNLVFSTQYSGGNFNPDGSDPVRWVGLGKYGRTPGTMDNFIAQVSPAVAPVVGVDASSVGGKVMCGYQGWFTAPTTGDSRWIHWGGFRDGVDHAIPDGTNLLTDMYPDMREFDADELFPTAMTIGSAGAAAPLYSGSNSKTVRRHVRWMQEYGIDGVFAQRFIQEQMGGDTSYKEQLNKTLWNLKHGCQEHGRVFAVMYDISGPADDDLWVTALKNDWMALVDQGITTGGRYLQQNGKPLVAIWGPGFTDRVPANPATALALINWFKTDAPAKYRASVMGGVPGQWRTLSGDSRTGAAWGDVYRAYDIISPWTVGRYNNNAEIDTWKTSRIVPDIAAAGVAGRAYGTVVWPGFSWKNLNNGTLNQIPRQGGAFYWRQIYNACAAGTTFIYVAMFDEVNEGTAITKVAENASQAPNEGFWVNLDADGTALPSDWYLRLTYEAGRMLRGAAALTATLPTAPGPQTLTGSGLSNTWDGGGGADDVWSTPANWVGDVAPDFSLPLTFASAYVGAANSAYQYDEPPPTIKGLNFAPSAGSFTLFGFPIKLEGDVSNLSTRNQTLNLAMELSQPGPRTFAATAGNILLGGSCTGVGGIRKTGDQTLTLAAWNRHTGGTDVVAGTLTFLGVQGEDGNIAGNLTIRAGATVYLNDGWSLGYSGDSAKSVTSITIEGGSLVVGGNNTGGTSAQIITMTGGSIRQLGDKDFDWYLGNGGVSANPTLRTLASSVPAVVEGNIALRLGAPGNLTLDVALGGGGGADLLVSGAIKDGSETGGVIKIGSGKASIAGANTYSGNTRVDGGTLELAVSGVHRCKIQGNGINNAILGAGTVNLLGSLDFDLAGASNGYPHTWTIVAPGGPRAYGAQFNVLGFSNMGDGTWRRASNDRVYEFSQVTGELRTTEFGGIDPIYASLRREMTSAGYIVSTTDLLQTSLASTVSTGYFELEFCGGLSKLVDGLFGDSGTGTEPSAASATCGATGGAGSSITYTLNTTVNVRGYDLAQIISSTGWDNNRFGQRYDVEVHKVGALPSVFVPLASVDYRPTSSGTSSARVTLTGLIGFDGFNTGTLASGVDQVRFIFKDGSNYGHSMYRELDVMGTPTTLGGVGLSFSGGGFELPYLGAGSYQQGTAARGWTSIKKSIGTTVDYGGGILSNDSPYGNPSAPQGEQVALLKGAGGIEQVISGFEVGKTYTISFKAIGRSSFGASNPFQVLLDGQTLSFSGLTTITPPQNDYTLYAGEFTARNRTMTMAFLSTLTDGVDFSSYVDDVQIQDVPNAPVITSLGGILTGTVGEPFTYAITVTPDPAIYATTYQATGSLPAGLTLNAATGVISGTPTLAEDRSVLVTATNTGGTSTALSLQIQITGGAIAPYDQWLTLYPGLSNTSGSADPDQDGWTNNQEFLFGGDPTIASAGILTATRSGTQILFTFVARRTGATYAITSSTTLGSGAWLGDTEAEASLGTATDQTGVANPTDYVRRQFSVVPGTKKFYRVEASTVVP